MGESSLSIISNIFGYISTVVWSLSFHFQWYEVYKLKSAEGLSINFVFLNIIGFTYYFGYNMYAYTSDASFSKQVHLSDVLFATHALILVLVHMVFLFVYPRKSNKPNLYWMGFGVLTVSRIKFTQLPSPSTLSQSSSQPKMYLSSWV